MDAKFYERLRDAVRQEDSELKHEDALVLEFLNRLEDRVNELASQDTEPKVCEWGNVDPMDNFTAHKIVTVFPTIEFSLKISFYDEAGVALQKTEIPFKVRFNDDNVEVDSCGNFVTVPRGECCGVNALTKIASLLDKPLEDIVFG